MKKTLGICLFLLTIQAHAQTITQTNDITHITCDAPWGSRVDFFSQAKEGVEPNTFLMARDKITGIHPVLILNNADKTVTFDLKDSTLYQDDKNVTKTANMKVIAYNENQITFAGVLNNAPIMGTYYPKMNILYFSQQSLWQTQELTGANAFLFQSKCTVDTK